MQPYIIALSTNVARRLLPAAVLVSAFIAPASAQAGFCGDTITTSWSSSNLGNPVAYSGSFIACQTVDEFKLSYSVNNIPVTFTVRANSQNQFEVWPDQGYPQFTLTLSGIDFGDPSQGIVDAFENSPMFYILNFTEDSITITTNYGANNSVPWSQSRYRTFNVVSGNVNTPPVAVVAESDPGYVGGAVQLDGSASYDPDGDTLSYSWEVVSAPDGSAATLADADTASAALHPDQAGTYIIALTVHDGSAGSAPAEVVVEALMVESYVLAQVAWARSALDAPAPRDSGTWLALQLALDRAAQALTRGNVALALLTLEAVMARADGCVVAGEPDSAGPDLDLVDDCETQRVIYWALADAIEALTTLTVDNPSVIKR